MLSINKSKDVNSAKKRLKRVKNKIDVVGAKRYSIVLQNVKSKSGVSIRKPAKSQKQKR